MPPLTEVGHIRRLVPHPRLLILCVQTEDALRNPSQATQRLQCPLSAVSVTAIGKG